MSVDISVSITEDQVDIIATPTVNIVNVTNSASIDPGLYDLSEFTNTSGNPFVRTSGLSSYVPSTRSILTTSPLVGGGDLSANRTISIPQATSSVNGFLSSTDWTTFNNKQNALGFTPVPETRTLTINGVTQDLSADRTFTISTGLTVGTTPISSGTNGRVLFQGTGNVLQQSSSLFWDSTNNRLGIGTETPLNPIHAFGNTNANYTGINVSNSSTGNSAISTIQVANDTGAFTIQALGSGYTASGVLQPNSARFRSSAALSNGFFMGTSSGNLVLFTNDNERLRVRETTGNILINTTTDAGFRLDVNGTARVSGNTLLDSGIIATSTATTRLQGSLNYFTHNRIASSGVFGFQIATFGTVTSFWRWDGATYDIELGSPSGALSQNFKLFTAGSERMRISAGGNILINTTIDAGYKLDVNGTARVQGSLTLSNSGQLLMNNNNIYVARGTGSATDGMEIRALSAGTDAVKVTTSSMAISSSGGLTYQASAQLAVDSTTRGFLPPRGSNAQMLAIASPAKGLIFFDNTNNKLNCYDGTTWQPCW